MAKVKPPKISYNNEQYGSTKSMAQLQVKYPKIHKERTDDAIMILMKEDKNSTNAQISLSSELNGGLFSSTGLKLDNSFETIENAGGTNQFSALCFNWINNVQSMYQKKNYDDRNKWIIKPIAEKLAKTDKPLKLSLTTYNDAQLKNVKDRSTRVNLETIFNYMSTNNLIIDDKFPELTPVVAQIRQEQLMYKESKDHPTLTANLSVACNVWLDRLSKKERIKTPQTESEQIYNKSIRLAKQYVNL